LTEYDAAARLRPDALPPLVNAAQIYARRGQNVEAESTLRRALGLEPDDPSVNFNLGLLVAEKGDLAEAEQRLEAAYAAEPSMAQAAFNLAVIVADRDPGAAVEWSRRAWEQRPDLPRYAHTHAFYLMRGGARTAAVELLERAWDAGVVDVDVVQLLAAAYVEEGRGDDVPALYARAAADERLPHQVRQTFRRMSDHASDEDSAR
jgi:Flp pilus assembly protein TadD